MSEVVRITVVPRREMITVVNGGLSALCALAGIDREQAGRLQLATEEVFLYSVQTIRKAGLESMVTVRFCHHGQGFKIVLEYPGPKGPLDGCFRAGHLDMPEFKSFEAVGLCLASKTLDFLHARHWPEEGITAYVLAMNCPIKT